MKGPIIRVFDVILDKHDDVKLSSLPGMPLRFPPVITGVQAAIKARLWSIIGRTTTSDFVYQPFISNAFNDQTGKAGVWYIWDGESETRIGRTLPERYKHLEFLIGWSPYDVVERIETGVIPFPYKELIQYNQFEPKNPTT